MGSAERLGQTVVRCVQEVRGFIKDSIRGSIVRRAAGMATVRGANGILPADT
jgi:hypothetical protein